MDVVISGAARSGAQSSNGSLEEMIFDATSGALDEAGATLSDIDAVVLASSDLLDGRPISTMTLTGGTGTWSKAEIKVCDDALAAVTVAVAEILAGHARRVLVSAWSKLSDTSYVAVERVALDPFFSRPLALDRPVFTALRESCSTNRAGSPAQRHVPGGDVAVAAVLNGREHRGGEKAVVLGTGQVTGSYLALDAAPLEAVAAAGRAALTDAHLTSGAVDCVRCAAFHNVRDEDLLDAVGAENASLQRVQPVGVEFGYAAGLISLCEGANAIDVVTELALSVSGVGDQKGYAVVIGAPR